MIVSNPIWDIGHIPKDPKLAFVVMPFREKWSSYIYDEYVQPLLRNCGLSAVRADEMYGRNVLQDIWRALYSARLVVADISAPNENVFYELGIAHTLGKKTILLTQDIKRVPFDLQTQRIIQYSDDHPGYQILIRELPLHVHAVLEESIDEIHHIKSTLGGFMVVEATEKIILEGSNLVDATIVDSMDIIGTRNNVVLVNKVQEHPGELVHVKCNKRFVRSDQYPNMVRVAAMFDEPYLHTGDKANVTFEYKIRNGFSGETRGWEYHIGVDTERLTFQLIAPLDYSGSVRVVRVHKPVDYDLEVLEPEERDGKRLYVGTIGDVEIEAVYAIRWS